MIKKGDIGGRISVSYNRNVRRRGDTRVQRIFDSGGPETRETPGRIKGSSEGSTE